MMLMELLGRSAVAPALRAAIDGFAATGRASEHLMVEGRCPPVKVERTLAKMLEEFPALAIERVRVRGESGCEFFRGDLIMEVGDREHRVEFHWDCRWRALQKGWTDCFGFPDQGRAAREFGHDCFRRWEERSVQEAGGLAAARG